MSYWADDRALYREQRKLDAQQARAAKAIEASGQDRNGLDAKHESAVAKPFAESNDHE